jgi:1-acyl-sn-glycerol-3-phosphate acyltransferase
LDVIFRSLKILAIISVIFSFMIKMAILRLLVWNRWRRIYLSGIVLRFSSTLVLLILNIKVKAIGVENIQNPRGILFVGNHLSYIDVIVISSRVPSCFVTSVEIRETIGLGQICYMAGCLFVERRNKMNILNEVSEIRDGLQKGLNVSIFPESTSTNGEQILRFRKPLFVAALHAGAPVVPFCLNYRLVGGEKINKVLRDKIFWYGDMAFFPHLWALSGAGGIEMDITFLPPIRTKEGVDDASEVAARAQSSVESVFTPVTV